MAINSGEQNHYWAKPKMAKCNALLSVGKIRISEEIGDFIRKYIMPHYKGRLSLDPRVRGLSTDTSGMSALCQ